MCGICGEVRIGGGATSVDRLVTMRDALVHRGPDAGGVYVSPDRRAGLGFRRLRIIDLSRDADQPMANEDGSVQLVFNGEIYNFRSLRRELEEKGHLFRSRSDTEVIVHLYEEEGTAAIARLDGMFALGIWDERAERLVLARDRTGKKPLFYLATNDTFVFASEIKAFFGLEGPPLEVDPAGVSQYFIHGYVPGPSTLYKGVRQVEPASLVVVNSDGQMTTEVYWRLNLRPRRAEPQANVGDAASNVRALVTKAVERRLISDVPLGAFLSGGIDSAIVVGVMSRLLAGPVKTFNIGFEGDSAYDETLYARETARHFGTEHVEFRVKPSAVDLIDTLVWHHDGPFGDASAIPTYLVSRLTRQHVTVVLTGDGSDELFAGYLRFAAALAADRVPRSVRRPIQAVLERLPFNTSDRHWLSRGRRFAAGLTLPPLDRVTRWNSLFFDDLGKLLNPDFAAQVMPIDYLGHLSDEREQIRQLTTLGGLLHANFRSYLPDDLLVKTDRCTMANSLEARSPFLDSGLVDYVSGLPDSMKLKGLTTKAILRTAFQDLLPPGVTRRRKMGFGVPLAVWFRTELKDFVRDVLVDPSARYTTYLSAPYVRGLVTRHQAGEINAGLQLWSVLCFEVWLRSLPRWTRWPVAQPA